MKSWWVMSGLSGLLSSCGAGRGEDVTAERGEDGLAVVRQAAVCADVSGTQIERSLAVTDPVVLAKFGFARTMERIRLSADVASTETSLTIFQRWMSTFGSCGSKIDPNGYGIQCSRPAERSLAEVNPFATGTRQVVRFEPVAVMNRFDLAASNGSDCGEHRIVYAMNSTLPSVGGRAFIIFEASLPNPHPDQGAAGCLPVARFWQGLSKDTSADSRAAKLEQFFYTGGAIEGFAPVVQASHYGFAADSARPRKKGQVRTNFFVDNEEWQLREFKLRKVCQTTDTQSCRLFIEHVSVKQNPAEELLRGTHPNSATFANDFVQQVQNLSANNVNNIAMATRNAHNEFESVSQELNVVYTRSASSALRQSIRTRLDKLGSRLSVTNILNRATTQTCAGCHELSNGVSLGGGLSWPFSGGFVHIDEQSNLSPALSQVFLPRRKVALESFINRNCNGQSTVSITGKTVSGSVEGAPN